MPRILETVPAHLSAPAEAARAWFSTREGSAFKVTGFVESDDEDEDLQLILCGERDGQDVCLRERFRIAPAGEGFDVTLLEDETPDLGSPAPLLDPPAGVRARWLDDVLPKHAFTVLLFYRGFW
ncbi:MAG: hypothetical protein ACQGVC_03860 [Myxococcota bacterium]